MITAENLSPTAQRMLDSLPSYYWNNQVVLRVLQAWANEFDRMDGLLDTMKNGFVPALADDTIGLLSIWERTMRLPVAPAGVSIAQRQRAVCAAFQQLSAGAAKDVVAVLDTFGVPYTVLRETPANLEDTIQINFTPGGYTSGQFEARARILWPAHRLLHVAYRQGFILDVSGLDHDEL